MGQITLGQVSLAITFIVGLISGISYIRSNLHKWIADSLKDQFTNVDVQLDKVDARIDHLEQHMEGIDVATCKNFLVARLSELDKGILWDEIETERFWEQYEHYRKHGGNSYIENKIENLKEKGIL